LPDRQGWGQQHVQVPSGHPPAEGLTPPPPSQSGRPPQWGPPNPNPLWQRKRFWIVAGSIGVLLLVVGLLSEPDQAATPTAATAATSAPTTSAPPAPTTTAPPSTTVQAATVPMLVGMRTAQAKTVPSRRSLHWTIRYKSTSRFASGTVISQSSKAGAEVRPGASIVLVIAKAPPPPPTTAAPPPTTAAPRNCDPAYPDVCLHQGIGDYDCAGGSGNGPNYVEGPLRVLPPDPFDLDGNDNDGIGCESG
jgi:PASTA domain-containing protein